MGGILKEVKPWHWDAGGREGGIPVQLLPSSPRSDIPDGLPRSRVRRIIEGRAWAIGPLEGEEDMIMPLDDQVNTGGIEEGA